MHATARELNQRYWWTLLAETSQNRPKQFFEKAPLFQTRSRSSRKATGCQVKLVLLSLNSSFS